MYGIYYLDMLVWGRFLTEQQAYSFIKDNDLTEDLYTIKFYN